MGSGSASLAIGEVAGSASFVTSVVVGSMAIICPFQVGRAAFLRDIAFFMGCILFTMFMVIDGKITFVESILLIIVYIAYVSTVVFGNQKPKPVTTVDDMDEVDSRQNHSDPETGRVNGDNSSADEHGNTEVTATPTRTQPLRVEHSEQAIAMPTITLSNSGPQIPVITLNPSYNPKSSSRRCPAILYHPGNINTDPKRLGYAAVNREESPSPVTPVPDDQAHDPSYSLFQQALLHHSLILPDPIDPVHRRPSPSLRSRSFESPRGEVIEMFPQETCFEKVTTAFFPTLQDWHEKKLVVKILAIASAPIVLLLTLTLPVVDLDDNQEDPISGEREVVNSPNLLSPISEQPMQECPAESQYNSWCRTSATVQMILAPAFLTAVVTSAAGKSPFIIAVSLAGGVTLALVLRISSTEAKPPKFFEALAFVGFLVAVAWIFLVANEVVGILQAIGMILGLSDAILGLTVFAMGNSLGDLVANITIAKLGFPRMAFSACFGSPLLTLVVVPRNGYILGRWWGWFLISVYLVCMVTNVVLEVKVPSHRL
ncbi:hypothetical protein BGW38_004186 [Lunasporangiospora selenospora]|uniref:Sodium/calcium exchanger membrane region domain-containing protein n=1 Tax=Lunasporangiospora selenospora TaxID=979761 RepID=A0A9P6G5A9_9FUNG|nr:hypothetical protein BGW38_004186 [Lunasporangiospora selenospora]